MCGIVAVWQKDEPVDRDKLHAATLTLRHRGPDEQRTWVSSHQRVGLGHTRLSIVDLVTGSQPLHSSNGTLHAVVGGEFYDDEMIRQSMQQKGYTFATHSDSEILLPLYQEYGHACFSHLNGEFAFVLWDEKKQQLFAARDRFGVKPLYYTRYQGNLYLASEIKALLALGVPAKWNEDIYWQEFYNVPFANQSCFKGIHQIKPGHYLLADLNQQRFTEQAYWNLTFPPANQPSAELTEEEYCEQLRTHLRRAVKRRLRADVPVASYLSGGIDSSSVFVMMAEEASSPITAFNVAFEESKKLNEYKAAKAVAEHAGVAFQSLPVTMEDIARHYADTIWHTEVYLTHGSAIAKYLLSQFVHDHGYKVVLTGEGPDELLAGYPSLWLDCVKYSDHPNNQALVADIKALQFADDRPGKYFKADRQAIKKKLGYNPDVFQPINREIEALLDKDFLEKYDHRNACLKLLRSIPLDKHIHHGNMSMYLQCKTTFPVSTLNVVGDRTEMAHSIEGRQPFLDGEIVDFFTQLPIHYKARGVVEKYILRQAMKNKLPRITYKKAKHPFLSPTFFFHQGKVSSLYRLMQEVFHSDLLKQIPFVNPVAVAQLIDRLPQLPKKEIQRLEPYLHIILSSCFLAEQFQMK